MAVKERRRVSGGTTLNAAELKRCLRTVGDAVQARGAKPVLSNVLLAGGLLTATNLDVRIETAIDYHGEPMLLPHGRMLAILGTTAGEEVTLTANGTSCIVECGRGKWTLPLEDANEFPTWEPDGLVSVVRIPSDEFARAVHSVLPAHDNESSRYALGAMLVAVGGDEVSFVATDGRRLHLAKINHDQAVDDSETLIPSGVAQTMYRLAVADSDGVQLERSPTVVRAEIGGTTVTARQVEGRFPRWHAVLPEDGPAASTVERGVLASATTAAAIVTSEASKGVMYAFTKEGIHLTARSSEHGESSVFCEVVECGHTCNVVLDPAFVLEWVRALPPDAEPTVSVQAKDKASAVVLRNDCYTGVIMPLDPSA